MGEQSLKLSAIQDMLNDWERSAVCEAVLVRRQRGEAREQVTQTDIDAGLWRRWKRYLQRRFER